MALTGAMLKTIAGAVEGGSSGTQVMSWDQLAADCNDACRLLGFKTYEGYATLIANCCQESDYFRTTTEYSNEGDYQPYKGRTFIQVTWESNYDAFGHYAVERKLEGLTDPHAFVDDPPSLGADKWAWWGPCWYFSKSWYGDTLVEIADTWSNPNTAVAKAINMGDPKSPYTPGGMKYRDILWEAACDFGWDLMPSGGGGPLGLNKVSKWSRSIDQIVPGPAPVT